MKTRYQITQAFNSISGLLQPLCTALEVANRSDSEEKQISHGENGNLPEWAGTVFNPLIVIIDQLIRDKFGISVRDGINWGGSGSFYQDIQEAVISALVPTLNNDAEDIRHTPTGKIAKLKGVWHSVNADSNNGEYEVRYALPASELKAANVEND